MKRTVLVDMDHTLSDASWRDHLIGGPGGWDAYHSGFVRDVPIQAVADLVRTLYEGFYITILTVRPPKWKLLTESWLRNYKIPYSTLVLCGDDLPGDAKAAKLKTAAALELYRVADIALIIDDRQDVCEAFSALGIPSLQVRI